LYISNKEKKIVLKIITIYNGKYKKRHNSFKNIPIVKVKKTSQLE